MTVVVTGAAGRLGSRVVTLLDEHGHEVVATDLVAAATGPVPLVEIDLREPEAVRDLLRGADAVVHLGNHPGIGPWPPQQVLSENLTMNVNVFQAAAEQGTKRIVFASTVQLIGSHRDDRTVLAESARPHYPLDGDTAPDPANLYALSKSLSESMLRYYADRCGVDVTALRFPLLHDHQEGVGVHAGDETAIDVFEAFTGLSYADAARAVVAVLEADLSGYNVYLPALSHRHLDLGRAELMARFYPELPTDGELVDSSALTRDTGWQPSDHYRTSSGSSTRPTDGSSAS